MTVQEAATRLGISTAAVRALIRAGELPHYRPTLNGRRVVLDAADVEAHWQKCRQEGATRSEYVGHFVTLDCPTPFARRRA